MVAAEKSVIEWNCCELIAIMIDNTDSNWLSSVLTKSQDVEKFSTINKSYIEELNDDLSSRKDIMKLLGV